MNKRPGRTQSTNGGQRVKFNAIDRIVSYLSPVQGVKRARARAFFALSNTGYVAFGSNRSSMRGAFASGGSADTDINLKLEDVRASARDLWMNAPLATAILKRSKTNIIGYGLNIQPRIDRKFLGLTDEQADKWEADWTREFKLWAASKNCDASRTCDFYQLQALILISWLMSGDAFVLLPYKKRIKWPYQLCLKVVEADLVNNPLTIDDDKTSGGITVDDDGEPLVYHMQKSHPGAFNPRLDWEKIPAYGKTGRRNILHIFEKDRPGQRRGVPILAPVIETLKQISRLSEAELQAAVVTSFFTAFITTNGSDPLEGAVPESEMITAPATRSADEKTYEMGSGSIIGLGENEGVSIADPKRPNALFEPFFLAMAKQIGAAIEIPFEVVMLHFDASYSAARAALLQAWKAFMVKRNAIKREVCNPINEELLTEAVIRGRISCPGFFDDPAVHAAWCGAEWIGSGMGQINPDVETKAALSRINGNLSTHSKETAAIDGDDWDAMMATRVREQNLIRENGLEPKENATSQAVSAPEKGEPAQRDKPKNDADMPDDQQEGEDE